MADLRCCDGNNWEKNENPPEQSKPLRLQQFFLTGPRRHLGVLYPVKP